MRLPLTYEDRDLKKIRLLSGWGHCRIVLHFQVLYKTENLVFSGKFTVPEATPS